MISTYHRNFRRSRSLFGAAALLLAVTLVSGCQTTTEPDYLTIKYAKAVNCVRAHVDQRLTAKTETEDEIGNLVRAGIVACEIPMKSYIQSIVQLVLDQKRWVWLGEESRQAITEEIVISTSVMLQQEYNVKERAQ